ncbi:hypothetical protein Pmani_008737 [Petrolisthes manimaculis]|uniref:Uncharacterized protein n=1 Tax=Petrolisthes manimaculis TaxID=1843537 RepID=A0AAE1Q5P1_9EUCA|nr:hypothetical protein Pmani_008737 [Petrolisthes manimaculis]
MRFRMAAGGVEGVLVLDCGANSRPGSRIGARITDVNITSGQDLTGCIRFQFARLQRVNIAFVVIGTSTKPIMQLEVNVDNLRVCVRQQYWFHVLDRWLRPRRWYFVCITHSYDTGQVTTYFMGQVLSSHELTQSLLMQQATEVAVGHHSSLIKSTGMAFIGKITHFNLWGRVLSLEEVRELTWCEGEGEGDLNVCLLLRPPEVTICRLSLTLLVRPAEYPSALICRQVRYESDSNWE